MKFGYMLLEWYFVFMGSSEEVFGCSASSYNGTVETRLKLSGVYLDGFLCSVVGVALEAK